jgi:hypothetical protein
MAAVASLDAYRERRATLALMRAWSRALRRWAA